MSDPLEISIKGIDKIVKGLTVFPKEIKSTMQAAAAKSAAEILNTTGLMKYPPATEANQPGRYSIKTHRKMGYYIRGRGAVTPGGKQLMSSEKYGTKFYVKKEGYGVIIGNSAGYAKWLADENLQASHMAKIGWRKLIEVAKEKLTAITAIFNKWAQYTIDKLGL